MNRKQIGIVLLGLSAAMMLTACESDKPETESQMAARLYAEQQRTENVSQDAIFDNLTPELMTTDQRGRDVKGQIALTNDSNWRQMWEDLGRVFILDRPSRLSPNPSPY